MKRSTVLPLLAIGLAVTPLTYATIESVKVVNDTSRSIYIHQGGYAPSQRIAPGKWKRFAFPFVVIPPNSKHKLYSGLLVATAGGRWETTANGFTFLSQPKMIACLDYSRADAKNIKGRRVWTLSSAEGRDKDCHIKGFRQLWWQPPY